MPEYVIRNPVDHVPRASPSDMEERFPSDTWIDGSGNAVTNSTAVLEPDLTAVQGEPVKYWKMNGDLVELMTQPEQDAVDAAIEAAGKDSLADAMDNVDVNALSMWAYTDLLLREINILRGQHSLADRTLSQFKSSYRAAMDVGPPRGTVQTRSR